MPHGSHGARESRNASVTLATRSKPPANRGRPRCPSPARSPHTKNFIISSYFDAAAGSIPFQTNALIKFARAPEASRTGAAEQLAAAGVRHNAVRIAVGAGASYGSAKCWPPSRFAELANHLQRNGMLTRILFGAAGETDVSSAIASEMKCAPIDLTGETTVADLPALLSHCHVFIGNDSGAMHVAAAVGLPAVAIFGPTDPFGTAPVTPRHNHRS